jgi:drug/metabolite transporter (DMT)-like permease
MDSSVPGRAGAAPRAGAGSVGRGGDGWILVSALCFSTIPILATYGYASGLRTLPMLAWRFLLAIAILWIYLAVGGRLTRLSFSKVMGFLGMGGMYVCMTVLYFRALRYSAISTLTLLFYTYPAIVTFLAAAFLRERLTRTKGAALLLSLAGCLIVLRPRETGDWRGAAMALGASVLYSVYMLIGTRLTRGVDPFLTTAWVMSATAAVFLATAFARGEMGSVEGGAAWSSILGLALVATVMADGSFFAGLSLAGASRAAILSTVEPLFTIFLSAVLLGETIPPIRFLGGGLILGSVILIHRE